MLRKARLDGEGFLLIADTDTGQGLASGVQYELLHRGASKSNAYMCVMLSDCKMSRDLEATNGPRNKPGSISWHSRRISYLERCLNVSN